jgi:hypothetical protein
MISALLATSTVSYASDDDEAEEEEEEGDDPTSRHI